jgi:hypothetical protein
VSPLRPRGGVAALAAALLRASSAGAIPPLTKHALRQAVLRGVTPKNIVDTIARGTHFTQADNADIYVGHLHGRGYFYIVLGRGGLITVSRRDLTPHEVRRATINYGWQVANDD